jgi:hypothetical protein
MKPYGVPRNKDVECPDKADIALYGLNEERLRPKPKRRTRRIWKKLARRAGKMIEG